ncbi:unnamed protein product [Coregonus sp. 'balchen']|nr:unnamed protein product [Coregonus sp. 'balchen']
MSSSLLWAVDVYGKVYSLSTTRGRWERDEDTLLELKRITAGQRCSWGIGCDHHVYLNIDPGEVPIRYREETYENQRWNPVDGFTDVLLPTDRWAWSDLTGVTAQPLHSFHLPSDSWEWEGDWYVDQVCAGGDPTETGIPLDHPKRPPLPLSDISCGGWEMSDQPGRYHFLWGVSQQGQVWFRSGILPQVPEGQCWEEVEAPREVAQISAGPGDLLWAVLWDGQLLVRTGICLDSPTGSSWVVVDSPPVKEGGAIHVGVGVSVVWAITKDYKVWGVGEDRGLYFRKGVTPSEPSGRGWIPVSAKWGHSKEMVQPSAGYEFGGQVTKASQGSVLTCEDSGDTEPLLTATPGPRDTPKPFIPTSESFISSLVADREPLRTPTPTPKKPPQGKDGEVTPAPMCNVDLEAAQSPQGEASSLGRAGDVGPSTSVATYPLGLEPSLEASTARKAENTSTSKEPVERSAGSMRWWRDWKPYRWVDVGVALEQSTNGNGKRDAIFFIYFTHDVTVLVPVLRENSHHAFAVYTSDSTKQRWPLVLAAQTEKDMADWLSLLAGCCCEARGISGTPSRQALWSVTSKGDVMVPGHLRCVESNSLSVVWGIGLLPTDRFPWSDDNGFTECTKSTTHPPSPQWSWVTEWAVDFAFSGGTDKEGWQYAADFPVTFHGNKSLKDFVRRRRWFRKCKITLTAPWQEVPPIPLSDITVLPCLAQSSMEQVPVWGLSDKGDVLCRLGVTPQNPAGSSWLHVGTDQPFKSISIGGGHQVWAIARDRAVFYRGSVSASNPAGNLWYRQGLTPSYPQGSAWELISNNVTKVSVGPLDQVWVIADWVPGCPSELSVHGAVCHRLGGGWEHISVRGNSTEVLRAPHPATPALTGTTPRSPLPARPALTDTTPHSPLPARPALTDTTPRSPLPARPALTDTTPHSPLPARPALTDTTPCSPLPARPALTDTTPHSPLPARIPLSQENGNAVGL